MFGEKTKRIEALVLFTILVVALCDVFFFNIEYGTLTTQFKLVKETNLGATTTMKTLGPFIVGAITVILFLIIDTYGRTGIFSLISLTVIIAELAVGITKTNQINKRFSAYSVLKEEVQENSNAQGEGIYTLSKGGKNVVVIFLDRAVNSLFPYAMEQLEGLKEQYEGFTYYPNTVSFGNVTVIGSPAMMGGYEYTPDKMNEREGFLQDLHNEASTLAPILFSNAGYSVTVTDPPFPNYSARHDLSAFSSIDNVKTGEMYDKFLDRYISKFVNYDITDEELTSLTENGAVNFSILQIIPNIFRMTFYCNCFDSLLSNSFDSSITDTDAFKWLSALYYLDESTSFTESGNTYTFIGNELTHNPILLNSELLAPATDDDTFDSIVPKTSQNAINHYSSFCAALKQIRRWIDYLKENDCYDNTRIIITSDHGTDIDTGICSSTMSTFMPLLLFKDFNARGELETDETFMTNADTLFLSTEGLEEITMVNPYTGNDLVEEKENGATVYGIYADEWNAPDLIGRTEFTIEKGYAYHVSGNALDSSAWIPLLEWEEMIK